MDHDIASKVCCIHVFWIKPAEKDDFVRYTKVSRERFEFFLSGTVAGNQEAYILIFDLIQQLSESLYAYVLSLLMSTHARHQEDYALF